MAPWKHSLVSGFVDCVSAVTARWRRVLLVTMTISSSVSPSPAGGDEQLDLSHHRCPIRPEVRGHAQQPQHARAWRTRSDAAGHRCLGDGRVQPGEAGQGQGEALQSVQQEEIRHCSSSSSSSSSLSPPHALSFCCSSPFLLPLPPPPLIRCCLGHASHRRYVLMSLVPIGRFCRNHLEQLLPAVFPF